MVRSRAHGSPSHPSLRGKETASPVHVYVLGFPLFLETDSPSIPILIPLPLWSVGWILLARIKMFHPLSMLKNASDLASVIANIFTRKKDNTKTKSRRHGVQKRKNAVSKVGSISALRLSSIMSSIGSNSLDIVATISTSLDDSLHEFQNKSESSTNCSQEFCDGCVLPGNKSNESSHGRSSSLIRSRSSNEIFESCRSDGESSDAPSTVLTYYTAESLVCGFRTLLIPCEEGTGFFEPFKLSSPFAQLQRLVRTPNENSG
ncbi:hypothetical protein KIN20_033272 [Parelaphostrongylus tenuis]|uniref:Uncharacterized protein n=1 Tax=Parelaphostrongylus tenuis TaxID=148309 RepID=A0AAD5R7S4_PARTN|nr:hypothetical protein KIN20_033272 [Parelaphostrongylus tenuis]